MDHSDLRPAVEHRRAAPRPPTPLAGEGLLHPLVLLAIAVSWWNDQWGKAAYHNLVTGKLSDVLGLIVFPLALQGLWELQDELRGIPWRPSLRPLTAASLFVASGFTLLQVSADASAVYQELLGAALTGGAQLLQGLGLTPLSRGGPVVVHHVADPADLLTLPAALLPIWLGRQRARAWRGR